jgi:hypothetical protein
MLGTLWSSSRFLELCPVGTVVRNGVDHRAVAGAGAHFVKVRIRQHNKTYRGLDTGGTEWVPCTAEGRWYVPEEPWCQIQSKDMFLPVQVVKRGVEEYERAQTVEVDAGAVAQGD